MNASHADPHRRRPSEGQGKGSRPEAHRLDAEGKVPSFAFASRESQKGFGEEATDIIQELSGGEQPRDNIYFNVVHTVDGAWNLDGKAMSNDELATEIGRG